MSTDQASTTKVSVLEPEEWVDAYGDFLFRYAYVHVGKSDVAEELVQETFLAALRASDQFEGRGSQRGWLMAILKNKIVDLARGRGGFYKHRRLTEDSVEYDELFTENGDWSLEGLCWGRPHDRMQMDELQKLVMDCLGKLPKSWADVFALTVIQEMRTIDICQKLNITSANFSVRMYRARLGMAKCVGAKWFSADEVRHAK